MKHKIYETYDEYLKHQGSKINEEKYLLRRLSKWTTRVENFQKKFKLLQLLHIIEPNSRILCLAARLGEEVKAFRNLGYDAIGIDINPGDPQLLKMFHLPKELETKDRYVIYGDFHKIPFPDNEFDYCFSNSIDHSLYVEKLSSEMYRVLKDKGRAVLEVVKHWKEFEVFAWEDTSELITLFEKFGQWGKVSLENRIEIVLDNPRQYLILDKEVPTVNENSSD